MGNVLQQGNPPAGGQLMTGGPPRPRQLLDRSWNEVKEVEVTRDEGNGHYLNSHFLPEDVIENILSFLDPRDILAVNQVCTLWKDITVKTPFWKLFYKVRKMDQEFERIPDHVRMKDNAWIVFYTVARHDLLNLNLIRNHSGDEGYPYKYWNLEGGTRNEWTIEKPPIGTDPLPNDPFFGNSQSCFVTSYNWAYKSQSIDLHSYGLNPQFLKLAFPFQLTISEMHGARFDCGGEYKMDIGVLGAEMEELFNGEIKYQHEERLLEGSNWTQFTKPIHFNAADGFDENNVGLIRYIVYRHKGKDVKFWAGNYGIKFARSAIRFGFDSTPPEKSSSPNLPQMSESGDGARNRFSKGRKLPL